MPNTPFMGLSLPIVSQTLGPPWATQLNAALAVIDSHNHTSGQGQQVPTAGLVINADLSFSGFNLTTIRSLRLANEGSALAGAADLACLYQFGGNLYFNSGTGAPVQITAGSVLAGTPGSIGGLASPAAVTYTSGNTKFTFTSNTNVDAQIDVGPVTIRQMTSLANGITLQSPNSLAASYALTLPGSLPSGQAFLTLDNLGNLVTGVLYANGITGAQLASPLTTPGALTVTGILTATSALVASTTLTVTGQGLFADGTVGAPGIAFSGEASSGWYRAAAGDLRLSVRGADVARFFPTGPAFTFTSREAAASTQDDFSINTAVTATTNRNFLNVLNNGVSVLRVACPNGQIVLGGLSPIILTDTTLSLQLLGNKPAADVGTDIVLNSAATRAAGFLLDVQNNGTTEFSVGFSGIARLANGTGALHLQSLSAGDAANGGLIYQGNKNAADVGTDHIFSTVATRTAGLLLDVQNNGTSELSVGFGGSLFLKGNVVAGTAAPAALILQGNQTAAGTGADVVLTGQATRTAGLLLDVQNNGASRLQVDFNGSLLIGLLGAINQTGSNAGMLLRGNKSAADAGSDFTLTSQVARTAGLLADFQNNGTSELQVAFNGSLSQANGGAAINMLAANGSLTLRGNRSAADAGADTVINSQATRTAGLLADVQNNGTSKAQVTFDGYVLGTNTSRYVFMTADQSTTVTTFSNVTGFAFSVAANVDYEFECTMLAASFAAGGFNVQFTGPTGASYVALGSVAVFGAIAVGNGAAAFSTSFQIFTGTVSLDTFVKIYGVIRNSVIAGTVQLQFASGTSTQGVFFRAGSLLRFRRVSGGVTVP